MHCWLGAASEEGFVVKCVFGTLKNWYTAVIVVVMLSNLDSFSLSKGFSDKLLNFIEISYFLSYKPLFRGVFERFSSWKWFCELFALFESLNAFQWTFWVSKRFSVNFSHFESPNARQWTFVVSKRLPVIFLHIFGLSNAF